ncbi:kinesin [Novymonas esmeraldas]|uniref:Kinesin n=1 Tax=Novymonas esmeraldas TaxID=1808958 RepID=A0AAW0EQC1_9TRYP
MRSTSPYSNSNSCSSSNSCSGSSSSTSTGQCSSSASSASPEDVTTRGGVARNGNLYVVDSASGARYHVTTTLQAPLYTATTVTHQALHRTVRSLLLASAEPTARHSGRSPSPPLLLLLDGVPLDKSNTATTLPDGAVVEVRRSPRSLSAAGPSELEMSLRSTSGSGSVVAVPRRAAPPAAMGAAASARLPARCCCTDGASVSNRRGLLGCVSGSGGGRDGDAPRTRDGAVLTQAGGAATPAVTPLPAECSSSEHGAVAGQRGTTWTRSSAPSASSSIQRLLSLRSVDDTQQPVHESASSHDSAGAAVLAGLLSAAPAAEGVSRPSRPPAAATRTSATTPTRPRRAAPSAGSAPSSSSSSAATPVPLRAGPPRAAPSILCTSPAEQPSLTAQVAQDAERGSIAAAAAAEQRRLLTRLQQHCDALDQDRRALLTARLSAARSAESATRLRALREAQGRAASVEVDAVRRRLGEQRDALMSGWLRVVHAHKDTHYSMPTSLLRELEDEGDALTLQCLSSIALCHTQRARLQALQQQRTLKAAEVARLRWEAHVRRCAAEERRGCLRVVARLRPPSARAWLPPSVDTAELDAGYAVRALTSACAVEVVDPPRDLRRRYALHAAYDAASTVSRAGSGGETASPQQRLFAEQLQPLLEHMCRTGQHVAVLALGAVGSGKTHALVGPRAAHPPPARRGGGKEDDAAFSCADFSSDSRSSRSSSSGGGNDGIRGEGGRVRLGITSVGAAERHGITRCLAPTDTAAEERALLSAAAGEAAEQRQRSAERRAREERRWRERAGLDEEDGLLPRAVAWLTAHLRGESPRGRAAGPVVESVVFSMYEVYNDRVYDLLPAPPAAAESRHGSAVSSPAIWPRWNAGWLPAPHIKNSNPEGLTELRLELVPSPDGASRDAAATVSQLLQPPAAPRWRVKASEVEVRSAAEALQAIQLGLHRRRTAGTLRSAHSSRSHLFLRFRVEVLRPAVPARATGAAVHAAASSAGAAALEAVGGATQRAEGRPKGYDFLRAALATPCAAPAGVASAAPSPTCVAELLFTDLAGSERVELSGAAGDALKESQYIHASLSAVSEVLAAVARANPSCDGRDGRDEAAAAAGAAAGSASAATLVQRWGAMVSRPGVSLSRSAPVFLQPRFLRPGGGRGAAPHGEPEGGLALRRRVLALMDAHVAGEEAAQWWRRWRAPASYVPFRTCKTTQLLRSTLGAPCKALVLACVRPCGVAEVVLPASLHDRRGPRARATAQALFAHQAPVLLSEVHATLSLASRIHDASQHADAAAAPQHS